MARGIVKVYLDSKRFGFITPAEGDEDIFFHLSGCVGNYVPAAGDPVEYSAENDRQKRLRACLVRSALAPAVAK